MLPSTQAANSLLITDPMSIGTVLQLKKATYSLIYGISRTPVLVDWTGKHWRLALRYRVCETLFLSHRAPIPAPVCLVDIKIHSNLTKGEFQSLITAVSYMSHSVITTRESPSYKLRIIHPHLIKALIDLNKWNEEIYRDIISHDGS